MGDEVTISLRRDPDTGKQNIVIKLRSGEDALPHEHEQQHRAIVDKLLAKGLVKEGELGNIVIEREEEGAPAIPSDTPVPERQAMRN